MHLWDVSDFFCTVEFSSVIFWTSNGEDVNINMERIDLYGENILLNKQDTSDLNLESFLVLTLAALMGYISGLFVNGKKCT